ARPEPEREAHHLDVEQLGEHEVTQLVNQDQDAEQHQHGRGDAERAHDGRLALSMFGSASGSPSGSSRPPGSLGRAASRNPSLASAASTASSSVPVVAPSRAEIATTGRSPPARASRAASSSGSRSIL